MTLGTKMTFKIQHQRSMKEITDSLDFITIKNFCSAKENGKIMIRKATGLEKTFANATSDKDYFPKYTKTS